MSWMIQFIHKNGGTATFSDESLSSLKERVKKNSEKYSGVWIASSVPFIHTACLRTPAWWRAPCPCCGQDAVIKGMEEIAKLVSGGPDE